MRHLVLSLVLALAMGVPCTEADWFPTWQVDVFNGMNKGDLFVHCKSKDDDLGRHKVIIGFEFTWTFRVNFFGTTLFWCYLRKPGGDVAFDAFWVEKGSRDWLGLRCDKSGQAYCSWIVRDDGIYLTNLSRNVDELVHKWKPLKTH